MTTNTPQIDQQIVDRANAVEKELRERHGAEITLRMVDAINRAGGVPGGPEALASILGRADAVETIGRIGREALAADMAGASDDAWRSLRRKERESHRLSKAR